MHCYSEATASCYDHYDDDNDDGVQMMMTGENADDENDGWSQSHAHGDDDYDGCDVMPIDDAN